MTLFAIVTVRAASVGSEFATTDEFGAPLRDACRARPISGGGLTCNPAQPARPAVKVPSVPAVAVARPAERVRKSLEAADNAALAGHYLVIGSFSDRDNATAWAARNAEFAPEVAFANGDAKPSYRVLVGPLAADTLPMMRAVLEAAGITSLWPLTLCQGGADWNRSCDELAAREAAVAVNWRPRPAAP